MKRSYENICELLKFCRTSDFLSEILSHNLMAYLVVHSDCCYDNNVDNITPGALPDCTTISTGAQPAVNRWLDSSSGVRWQFSWCGTASGLQMHNGIVYDVFLESVRHLHYDYTVLWF